MFKNAKALPNKMRALIQSGRLESAIDELDDMKGHVLDNANELVEQLLEGDEDDDEDEKDDKCKPDDKVKPNK
ncbi:MAG: hypothetical protein OEW93_00085 [Candidatus Bathyarchaeota archaeon]|nr:hypothetical protein [Candidatus Bathyarchaeota archaeon]MDH5791411.1 hypothetical protein [Candidatus Bathyarchaeota archaeon]